MTDSARHSTPYNYHREKTQQLLNRLEGYLAERIQRSQQSGCQFSSPATVPEMENTSQSKPGITSDETMWATPATNRISGPTTQNRRLAFQSSSSNETSPPESFNSFEYDRFSPVTKPRNPQFDPKTDEEVSSHFSAALNIQQGVNWRLLALRKRTFERENRSSLGRDEGRGSSSSRLTDTELARKASTSRQEPVCSQSGKSDSPASMSAILHKNTEKFKTRSRSAHLKGSDLRSTISNNSRGVISSSGFSNSDLGAKSSLRSSSLANRGICDSSKTSTSSLRSSTNMANCNGESAKSVLQRRLNYTPSVAKTPSTLHKQISGSRRIKPTKTGLKRSASLREPPKTTSAISKIDVVTFKPHKEPTTQTIKVGDSNREINSLSKEGVKSKLLQSSEISLDGTAPTSSRLQKISDERSPRMKVKTPERSKDGLSRLKRSDTLRESNRNDRLSQVIESTNETAQTEMQNEHQQQTKITSEIQRRPILQQSDRRRSKSVKRGELMKSLDIRVPTTKDSRQGRDQVLNKAVDHDVAQRTLDIASTTTDFSNSNAASTTPRNNLNEFGLRSRGISILSSSRAPRANSEIRTDNGQNPDKFLLARVEPSDHYPDLAVESINLKLDRLSKHIVQLRKRVEKDYAEAGSCSPGDDIYSDEAIGAMIHGQPTGMHPVVANSLRNIRLLEANVQEIFDLLYPNEIELWSPKIPT